MLVYILIVVVLQKTAFPSRLGGATWGRLTPIKVGRTWNRNEAERYVKECTYLITLLCYQIGKPPIKQHNGDHFGSFISMYLKACFVQAPLRLQSEKNLWVPDNNLHPSLESEKVNLFPL